MASSSSCHHPGRLCSSFSPSSLKFSSFQRGSVQFIHTQNHTCSLPSIPRPLTVISMAPPKPAGGKAKKDVTTKMLYSRSLLLLEHCIICESRRLSFSRTKIRAVVRSSERSRAAVAHDEEEACVKFAFVSSVLLPDGTPDVQLRIACGGQKLRDIMLDANVELYGPYARPLLNCGGGGTCATCLVEVVEGKELLNPRTDKENENLKRHPKNWRLACQAIVGKPDSRGMMTIQQLPEWKAHEWNYRGLPPNEEEEESISSSSA